MTKYVLPTIGLALLWGLAAAQAGEATCCGTAGCETGCNTGCQACCDCCPHCGCKLVPVCQMTCETKKTTEHKYCCKCKEICIPGVTRIGERCDSCDNCGACGGGCNACDPCNNGCQDSCDCRCRIREVHKLVVCPVTKEHCVRACTVQWVCPNCSHCGSCDATSAPSVAPTAPAPAAPAAPVAPAPSSNRLPPPPKTNTTSMPPVLEDVGTAQAGF